MDYGNGCNYLVELIKLLNYIVEMGEFYMFIIYFDIIILEN